MCFVIISSTVGCKHLKKLSHPHSNVTYALISSYQYAWYILYNISNVFSYLTFKKRIGRHHCSVHSADCICALYKKSYIKRSKTSNVKCGFNVPTLYKEQMSLSELEIALLTTYTYTCMELYICFLSRNVCAAQSRCISTQNIPNCSTTQSWYLFTRWTF